MKDLSEKQKIWVFPKDLGACIARLAAVQRAAEKIAVKLKPLAEEEKALREHLINKFPKDKLKGARGSGLSLNIFPVRIPQIEDWAKFFAFAKKKGNEDLLPQSIARDAWKQRADAGKTVPGIKIFATNVLRVTKDKGEKK